MTSPSQGATIFRLAITAMLALAGTRYAAAQTPLPSELEFTVQPPGAYAASLELTEPGGPDRLHAHVGFENTERRAVIIRWTYLKSGALPGITRVEIDVPYRVTAVAAGAGSSTVLYIAGWKERQGVSVLERWSFDQWALGQVLPPTGGEPRSILAQPTIHKEELPVGGPEPLPPIQGLALQPYSQQLWLLTFEDMHRILTLPLDPGAVYPPVTTELATVTSHPYLAHARSLRAAQSKLGEFFVLVQERILWKPIPSGQYVESVVPFLESTPPPPPPRLLVLGDVNRDGMIDLDAEFTYAEFRAMYPTSSWDMAFTAP